MALFWPDLTLLVVSVFVMVTRGQDTGSCQLTMTLNPSQIQTLCQRDEPHRPPGLGQGVSPQELQNIREDMAALQDALDDIQAENEALQETVRNLEQETASWREIIEWPLLEPNFQPDDDQMYIDPDGPTYKDCQAAVSRTNKQGIYTLAPGNSVSDIPFLAYCDEEGWTVIQRRFNGSVDFYREWNDYMRGFGQLGGEFWLGLENIYRLTNQQDSYTLRLEALGYNNKLYYSENPGFRLNSEVDHYEMAVENRTEGNFKDLVVELDGTMFTTQDNDNDQWWDSNCAHQYRGAFWLKDCGWDLNRQYCDGQGCMRYGDRTIKKSLIKMKVKADGQNTELESGDHQLRQPKKNKKKRKQRNW